MYRGVRDHSLRSAFGVILIVMLSQVSSYAFPLADEDTAVIDTFIAQQARRERGEEYKEARKVIVGDLNHDGSADVAVLYTIEGQMGGNNYVQYLAVFVRVKGRLGAVTHVRVGGKWYRAVELRSISDNTIVLETLSYAPNDAACCPSRKDTTHYVLVGRTLRERRMTRVNARRFDKAIRTKAPYLA